MSQVIKPEQFAAEIEKILDKYGDETTDVMKEIVPKVTKNAAKSLKSAGSFGGTGKYRKGWKTKVEESRLSIEGTVYNGAAPGLTHLLEFGHVKQNGGRTRAFPHIAEVNDKAQEEFEKELIAKL